MWLFARDGFYSVVQKPEDKALGRVSVRARRRDDLDKLIGRFEDAGFGSPEPIKTFHADYPWRIVVDKAQLASVVFDIVMDIDYSNFKNTQNDRHSVMMDIWSAARKLERPPALRGDALPPWPRKTEERRDELFQMAQPSVDEQVAMRRTGTCGSWVYTGKQGHPFRCALPYGHDPKVEPHRSKTWLKKHAGQRRLPLDGV